MAAGRLAPLGPLSSTWLLWSWSSTSLVPLLAQFFWRCPLKVGHQRRRHGDLFPLDSGALRDLAAESGCFEPQRAQWIGDSLDKLALHTSN